jgi:cardiolipin synthase (CMP-forming)
MNDANRSAPQPGPDPPTRPGPNAPSPPPDAPPPTPPEPRSTPAEPRSTPAEPRSTPPEPRSTPPDAIHPESPESGAPAREGSPIADGVAPVVHTPPTDPDPTDPNPTKSDPTDPASEGPGPLGPSRRVSTAILTAPNAITLVRLLLMPVCAYLLATGRFGWGLVLTAVVGSTDWVDGWLARRTGQVSRLGQLLDPLADRLLIASVAIALLVQGVLPWLAVVLLVARDLILLCGWPLLKRRGIEPPEVILLGKAATLVLLIALPVLTLGATGLAVADLARLLGLATLWAGVVLYYLAGAVYVRMVLERLGHRPADRGPGRSKPTQA